MRPHVPVDARLLVETLVANLAEVRVLLRVLLHVVNDGIPISKPDENRKTGPGNEWMVIPSFV